MNESPEPSGRLPRFPFTAPPALCSSATVIAGRRSQRQFSKNQNLYFAALNYYYEREFSYVELGDGDELWENRSISQIIDIHSDVFWLLREFQETKGGCICFTATMTTASATALTVEKHCSTYHCSGQAARDPSVSRVCVIFRG